MAIGTGSTDRQEDLTVGSYAAIADASETLLELLRDRIATRSDVVDLDRSDIALVSPDEVGADSDVRLSLYLYDVAENTVMANADRQVGDDGRVQDPPLALDLRYLVTAYPSSGGNDETANTIDQQRVLGLAMQVLDDESILGEDALRGSLGEKDLSITFEQPSMEELTSVWTTFSDTPLHPSVSYHVSPVLIESTVERDVDRVTERDAGFGTPQE